ncbi:MAG: hypothetical protein JO307_02810, partial [Bryobacterales bacterium]|nr:hypothetical protein [Bryobacterales bacterium]
MTEINQAAAVLAALLLGLFGAGGTAPAQAQSVGSTWLRIMAFADAPVAGAEVRVSVYGPYGWPLVDV